jgi:hypothetical protein
MIELRDHDGVGLLMSTPEYRLLVESQSEPTCLDGLFISDGDSVLPNLDCVKSMDAPQMQGYSQQIYSVALCIMSGIPNLSDLMALYHGSSDIEKTEINPIGYDFIMQRMASTADLDDLNLIYRDAMELFAQNIPFRFYTRFIDRLLVSKPHKISVQDVLRDMMNNYYPHTGMELASMLQSHLISPAPTTAVLDEILSKAEYLGDMISSTPFTPNFSTSLIDRCVALGLEKQIPYAISAIESLSPSLSSVINYAIVVLANAGLLNHAIHYLTDLAVIRREKVSRSSFVALVIAFILNGDVELARSLVAGMSEAGYVGVKADEWVGRIKTSEDVKAVKGFVERTVYYRVLVGLLDVERAGVLEGVEEVLSRRVEIENRGSCRIGVHVVMDGWKGYKIGEKRDWRGVIGEGRVCCEVVDSFLKRGKR